jgi:hypothetical protein
MRIVADYDGASIDVVSISDDILTLALKADPPCELEGGKLFAQHFCFTVSGAAGRDLEIRIGDAGSAMCSEAYNGCAPSSVWVPMFRCDVVWMRGSYQCLCADGSADGTILPPSGDEADNGESWFRAPTTFDGTTLTIRHRATHESCTYVAQSGNAQHPTCSTPRTAQVPTGANVGEPIAETQHRHGPCRDGRHACPTPAMCTGTEWAHPTHTYSRTRTETGLSSPTSGPGIGG